MKVCKSNGLKRPTNEYGAVILGSVLLLSFQQSRISTCCLSDILQHLYLPILVLGFFAKPLGFTGGAKALTAFPEMTTSRGLSASFHHSGMEPKIKSQTWRKGSNNFNSFCFLCEWFYSSKSENFNISCPMRSLWKHEPASGALSPLMAQGSGRMRKRDTKNGSTEDASIPTSLHPLPTTPCLWFN